jgi:hypothetical protein
MLGLITEITLILAGIAIMQKNEPEVNTRLTQVVGLTKVVGLIQEDGRILLDKIVS